MAKERPKFRFMHLEIWQGAMEVAGRLFDLADRLESKTLYRFAEQLRGSGLHVHRTSLKALEQFKARILNELPKEFKRLALSALRLALNDE